MTPEENRHRLATLRIDEERSRNPVLDNRPTLYNSQEIIYISKLRKSGAGTIKLRKPRSSRVA
jgi:hypothetical protein